jgi:drug/metabolite transporter (DMT)-like permease
MRNVREARAGGRAYRSGVSAPPRWLTLANLWTVYLVWGSTYLAIRVAVETIPPFLGAGFRFTLAGLILAAYLLVRGRLDRSGLGLREIAASGLVGVLLLLGGNGLVMFAEQTVPSGLAALIIASTPLWIVVLRAAVGERISRTTLASVLVGFVGVALLVLPHLGGELAELGGVLILLVASISWVLGSFWSPRLPLPRDPLTSTMLQQLLGGMALTAVGVVVGEPGRFQPSQVSTASAVALAYLVVFGSLVAFSAYTWLLHHVPLSTVSTYAYVNPVIAVLLGWAVLSEELTPSIIAGAIAIVASVAMVVRQESLSRRAQPAPVPAVSPGSAPGESPGP